MNIDVIKFWYVFLWIRDLVLSKTNHVDKMTNSVKEELNNLTDQINTVIDDEKKSHSFSLDLKVNNRRIGQGIKNKYTLKLIKRLIEHHLETYDRSEYSADICELNSRTALEKNQDRAATHKLFLFHKYMKVYLEDKGGKKNCLIPTFTFLTFFKKVLTEKQRVRSPKRSKVQCRTQRNENFVVTLHA